jgi:hypothetical protein
MGREVRRVPLLWQHPTDKLGEYIPLLEGYTETAREFTQMFHEAGLQAVAEYFESVPDRDKYMPEWTVEECNGYCMYENTSEGTPISPVFESKEALATWLYENKASAFGGETATYEQWLKICERGYATSTMFVDGKLMSGVVHLVER